MIMIIIKLRFNSIY